jgi:hypothetical protein
MYTVKGKEKNPSLQSLILGNRDVRILLLYLCTEHALGLENMEK